MTQFEVFANPVARARASYPFIVMLQADVARGGRERAVARNKDHERAYLA
jgi:hypothetical protein